MIGNIISGIGNLIAGVGGYAGAKYAANAQLQATKDTNATNIRLAKEQRDWSYQMQQEQNAYNSLASQRQRAEEAGFSPYILNGSNSQMQSSLPSYQVPQQNVPSYELQAQAAQMLANIPSQFIQSVLSSAQTESVVNQAQKTGAEKQSIEIENQYKVLRILMDLEKTKSETENNKSKKFFQDLQNQIVGAQKKEMVKRAGLENELIASQAANQFAQEMLARSQQSLNAKQYRWLDAEKRYQLAQTSAYIGVLSAQKGLTEAQTKLAIKNAIIMELQQAGIKSDNEVKQVAAKYADLVEYYKLINVKSQNAKLGKEIDWYNYNQLMHSVPNLPFMMMLK